MPKKAIFSPAKINLALRVGDLSPVFCSKQPPEKKIKRFYHQIRSILVAISWGDQIDLDYDYFLPSMLKGFVRKESSAALPQIRWNFHNELWPGRSSEQVKQVMSPHGENFTSNLLYRLLEKIDRSRLQRLAICLHKRIPLGSGLGGGSSNAGSLLRYFYRHSWSFPLRLAERTFFKSQRDYLQLAMGLGADVSFFFRSPHRVADIGGFGEKIISKRRIPRLHGVLCLAPFSVSTAWAYKKLKRPLQKENDKKSLLIDCWPDRLVDGLLQKGKWQAIWEKEFVNDFEGVVFARYPQLRIIKNEFYDSGAFFSLLAGSGSSVFALCAHKELQKQVIRRMAKRHVEFRFIPFYTLS